MGRKYTIEFSGVAVAAAQDLITIFAGSGMAFTLHSVELGQVSATAVGNLPASIKKLTASVTAGSGGTAPTPQPTRSTDAAATVTAHANDTTRSTGAASISLYAAVLNVINGFLYLPPAEDRFSFKPGEACVISLDGNPGSSETFSGTAVIEESF